MPRNAQIATHFPYTTLFRSDTDPTLEMRTVFSDRLDTLYNMIINVPGITCDKPSGAFYLFPNVKEAVKMNGFTRTDEWVKALLEEEKVALVPGFGFGCLENVFFSFVTLNILLILLA